ncbi:MAG TPA: zinc metallopeptidase, partial [Clostridiaceae bacterium]|nr:zinc metallopeptidase [Clostridiaceae bacterium]
TLNLSDSVRDNRSLAAIGVAAHECGHAIQDNQEYFPLVLRRAMVPITNISSMLSMPLILIGVLMSMNQTLINFGIILFSFAVVFQLITLPVEFNASRRALNILESRQILTAEELPAAKKVLRAAALTYVAALLSSLLQLLRLVLLFGGRSRD